MALRNKLVASEDFKDWLYAKINNGSLAEKELNELNAQPPDKSTDDWYERL